MCMSHEINNAGKAPFACHKRMYMYIKSLPALCLRVETNISK